MSQPWTPPPPAGLSGPPPGNNLILAIIATVVSVVFCCLPHGVVSLIFALQVDKKAAAGDMQGAVSAAKQAKIWAIVSIAIALVWLVIGIVFGLLNLLLSGMGMGH
jgi:ABC-type sugar transport system permease subunit